MKWTQHQAILAHALADLFRNDAHLFQVDANECSITHRLAMYIEQHLREASAAARELEHYVVDCEYNRDEHRTKYIRFDSSIEVHGERPYAPYPDIILHRRGGGEDRNKMVVEVKKSTNAQPSLVALDLLKLTGFLENPLYYDFGVFLNLKSETEKPHVILAKKVTQRAYRQIATEHRKRWRNDLEQCWLTGTTSIEQVWQLGHHLGFVDVDLNVIDGKQRWQ